MQTNRGGGQTTCDDSDTEREGRRERGRRGGAPKWSRERERDRGTAGKGASKILCDGSSRFIFFGAMVRCDRVHLGPRRFAICTAHVSHATLTRVRELSPQVAISSVAIQ